MLSRLNTGATVFKGGTAVTNGKVHVVMLKRRGEGDN